MDNPFEYLEEQASDARSYVRDTINDVFASGRSAAGSTADALEDAQQTTENIATTARWIAIALIAVAILVAAVVSFFVFKWWAGNARILLDQAPEITAALVSAGAL